MQDYSLELVVAHYHENLNWLRKVPPGIRKVIYSKAGTLHSTPCTALPNVGREAHTYLHHLVTHYDSLADFAVFCQGKPFDHAFDFHHSLRAFAAGKLPEVPFQWLGHIIDTDTQDGQLFREWSKNATGEELDLAGFHQNLFGTSGPEDFPFVLGAQFVVARELVQRQPLAFYERALELAANYPNAAHCYERMWDRIFGVEGIDRDWLAGRKTVYLKQIKKTV
ncbi:DUF3431 domain-containing protein [Persicitalea jodogahamensis]|uniref:DUF3431 domain-containing protein n=1 Tax=Persicitalea jodogahamensis TaxID=402147 RepID=A0A8J3D3U3_9BACT|nr:DUF3431 domain-containing protein [Persicitalea jodogahamensis]GHB70455.1 hypothetical protein GCM10007390_25150 [Persicitalea jodogahamensis]